MMADIDEMIRTIRADAATTQLRAENLAMKVVLGQLVACTAIWQAHKDMSASEFVHVFKREGTNILLADSAFDGNPALEVLRTQAVKALQEFCDPIAASLDQFNQRSPGAAETSKDEPT